MSDCATCQLDYWTEPHCRECHHTWSGTGNFQHCVRCHETFSSTSSADAHEVMDKRSGEIFCLDPEERGLEWNEKRQMWVKPMPDERMTQLRALKAR